MKNILIVSYAFPPDRNSQAQHVFGIANLFGNEYNVDVMTVDKERIDMGQKFTVHYVPFGFLHHAAKKTTKAVAGNNRVNVSKKNSISLRVKNLIIPDPVADWYSKTITYYRRHLKKSYDVIIGIATPYTDLFITRRLVNIVRKNYNQDCKSIFVYADPWYGEKSKDKSTFRKIVEYHIEKKLINSSDFIFMVTGNAMKHYQNCFPQLTQKIDYYYLGHNFHEQQPVRSTNINCKVIKYFGSIQSAHRNPYTFLDAIENPAFLGKIRVELFLLPHISHDNLVKKITESEVLRQIVIIKNSVGYLEMIREIEDADYTLLFGNVSGMQIPGKLFDYIGIGSNILYIKNGTHSEIEDILCRYGASVLVENDIESIRKVFLQIVDNKIAITRNESVCLEMFRDSCYLKLKNKVKELTENEKG